MTSPLLTRLGSLAVACALMASACSANPTAEAVGSPDIEQPSDASDATELRTDTTTSDPSTDDAATTSHSTEEAARVAEALCPEGATTTSPEALTELADVIRNNGDGQLAADVEAAVITFSDSAPSAEDLANAANAINTALTSLDGLDPSCLGVFQHGGAPATTASADPEPLPEVDTVLEEQMGLPADQAACVADRLSTGADEAPDEIELLVALSECANAG